MMVIQQLPRQHFFTGYLGHDEDPHHDGHVVSASSMTKGLGILHINSMGCL
jgi:hypothetical protein